MEPSGSSNNRRSNVMQDAYGMPADVTTAIFRVLCLTDMRQAGSHTDILLIKIFAQHKSSMLISQQGLLVHTNAPLFHDRSIDIQSMYATACRESLSAFCAVLSWHHPPDSKE